MIQQDQVFRLKAEGADGPPLWAYRNRLEGRGSTRPQVGGFASQAETQEALRKVLDRLGPRCGTDDDDARGVGRRVPRAAPGGAGDDRQAALLLAKATATLGETRLAALSPKDVYAWRLTIPEGHRFEATQALRQVLNRAVDWGSTPTPRSAASGTRRGGPGRSSRSIRGSRLKRSPGPMVVFAAATGLRITASSTCDARMPTAGSSARRHGLATAPCRGSRKRLEALARLPRPENGILFPNMRGGRIDFRSFGRRHWTHARSAGGRHRAVAGSLRPAPHVRHLRAPRRHPGLRRLALHGLEHRDDHVATEACKAAPRQAFGASHEARAASRGHSVDVAARARRQARRQKKLISRNFSKAL